MSGGYRNDRPAIVVLAFLVGSIGLVSILGLWSRQTLNQPISQPQPASTEYYQEQRGPSEGYWWPEVAARDTYAQWAMSILALVATGTGILGVVWIRQTLVATRDTASAAIKAVEAAYGVERAWLTVEGTMVSNIKQIIYANGTVLPGWGFALRWRNDGRSPAVNAMLFIEHAIRDGADESIPVFRSLEPEIASGIIGPGRIVGTKMILLNPFEVEKVIQNQTRLYVHSIARYEDVHSLGKIRQTEVCFRMDLRMEQKEGTTEMVLSASLGNLGSQNSAT